MQTEGFDWGQFTGDGPTRSDYVYAGGGPSGPFTVGSTPGGGGVEAKQPGVNGYYMSDSDAAAAGVPPGMWVPYGSEGPGGFTGRGSFDPNTGFNGGRTLPPSGGDMGQLVDAKMGQLGPSQSWNPSMVDQMGQAWQASGGRTVSDLRAFVAAHPEYGATLTGSKGDKVTFPNGRAFDAVIASGEGGGRGASWGDISGGGGGGGAQTGGGTIGGLGNGQFLTPWTQQFNAPSAQDALNSPGLQFAMQQAQKGLEGSAAAHGTLLTGGTLKDLTAQQTGLALQGYGDVYGRALGEYGIARDNFYQNQDRPFGKLNTIAGLGAMAANQTGGYGSSYGNAASGAYGSIGNANSAGSSAQGSIWGNAINNAGNVAAGYLTK